MEKKRKRTEEEEEVVDKKELSKFLAKLVIEDRKERVSDSWNVNTAE